MARFRHFARDCLRGATKVRPPRAEAWVGEHLPSCDAFVAILGCPRTMFRWLVDKVMASAPDAARGFAGVVRATMAGTDEETVRIVVAVAGLLGTVAYADRC